MLPITGLGLPLVKMMIELHGGTLDLQSGIGVGTTAVITFPPDRLVDNTASEKRSSPHRETVWPGFQLQRPISCPGLDHK
jgi:hypothetical protein